MEDPRIISALFIFLKMAYYNVLINMMPFHVPIILSVHISLDLCYSPVSLDVPVTQHGRS